MAVTADFRGIAVRDPVTGKYSSAQNSGLTLVGYADFTDGQLIPDSIYPGATWNSFNPTRSIENGQFRADYPAGQAYPALALNIADLGVSEVSVSFQAKMPAAKGGLKFVKIFCLNSLEDENYCNVTFGIDYNGVDDGRGTINVVSFGDGADLSNDTQNGIYLDGSTEPSSIGRSFGTATVSTPMNQNFTAEEWGTGLHSFTMAVRFNSGSTSENEVADGFLSLTIDGNLYVLATNLFNSNPANSKIIDRVEFFGHAQNNEEPFHVCMDNINVRVPL